MAGLEYGDDMAGMEGGGGFEDDDMDMPGDVSDMMETHMEEGGGGGEDDYQGQLVEVEPEIFLGAQDGAEEEDHEFMMSGDSSSNQFFGDSYNDSSLAGFGEGFDGSNDGAPGRPGSARKTALGNNCPVCDQVLHRQHARDHVAWHFMDELKAMIVEPGCCPDPGCEYTGDKTENVARHLALYHSKLDDFLADQALVEERRARAMAKPKKVRIGKKENKQV